MKLKFLYPLSFILLLALIFNSCQYFSQLSFNEWKERSNGNNDEVDVYVAGTYGATAIPCYWKNGEKFDLEHPSISTYAKSIDIDGEDIYIGGYTYDGTSIKRPCYWKNGKIYYVENPDNCIITSIKVAGGLILSAGYTNVNKACFWTNDKIKILDSSGLLANAFSISVDKETFDFYISGWFGTAANAGFPCYWKNGDKRIVLAPASGGVGYSIDVSKGNVYVGGRYNNSTIGYWVNGKYTEINPAGLIIYSIKEYKGDAYTAGYIAGTNAFCWKNTTSIPLSQTGTCFAQAIDIYNNDVYVAGINNTDYAVYWKNGVMNSLPGAASASGNAIIVKPKKK